MENKIQLKYQFTWETIFSGDIAILKNNLQKKNLYLRAIWQGVLGFILIIVFRIIYLRATKNDGDIFLGEYLKTYGLVVIGYMASSFWEYRKTFESKWAYSAGLFNEISKMRVIDKQDYFIKENLWACLSLDLLHMDFWSHNSYYDVFIRYLNDAINFIFSDNPEEIERIKKIMDSGQLKYEVADNYLEIYQIHLVSTLDEIQKIEAKLDGI